VTASQKEKKSQRERLEARESTILAAATAVFVDMGVDGARMADIAAKADIAEGTLYLYYKNKQALLHEVVDAFWANLTDGAEQAVDPALPMREQLHQLASYHLMALLNQFDVVGLTYRARLRHGEPEQQLGPIRGYVRVFDRLVERGTDRGEIQPALPLWQLRDLFYGWLEFSARTLLLRGEGFDQTLIDNLVMLILTAQNQRTETSRGDKTATTSAPNLEQEILKRLSAIEQKLS
jgi:TetR/AcrR family fatty acid metabolism transcriptional regulator